MPDSKCDSKHEKGACTSKDANCGDKKKDCSGHDHDSNNKCSGHGH